MLCEVEFLAVGEGCRAGDAIVVRYGEINDFKSMVVEGGTADAGKALVSHLKEKTVADGEEPNNLLSL